MSKKFLGLKPSVYIAASLAIAVGGWLYSGQMDATAGQQGAASGEEAGQAAAAAEKPAETPHVRVVDSFARDHQAVLTLNGRTAWDRMASIRAEINGRVIKVNIEEGQQVKKGEVIARIAVNDRASRVEEAKALVAQRQIEFEAATKLANKGFQSKTRKAEAQANLSQAQATLKQAQIRLAYTAIRAPFDGVVNSKSVEIGNFADVGDPIAEIVDLSPIYVSGQVSEREIGGIALGSIAKVKLITGQEFDGIVSRIRPVANENTRTFKVDVEAENPGGLIQSGITAEINMPLHRVRAHLISPALLTLNDAGLVGVKLVDQNDIVRFLPVQMVEDTIDGIWVAGLPETMRIISVGQEYVIDGQKVDVSPDTRKGLSLGDAS